jgi:hypothetical protein
MRETRDRDDAREERVLIQRPHQRREHHLLERPFEARAHLGARVVRAQPPLAHLGTRPHELRMRGQLERAQLGDALVFAGDRVLHRGPPR